MTRRQLSAETYDYSKSSKHFSYKKAPQNKHSLSWPKPPTIVSSSSLFLCISIYHTEASIVIFWTSSQSWSHGMMRIRLVWYLTLGLGNSVLENCVKQSLICKQELGNVNLSTIDFLRFRVRLNTVYFAENWKQ